MSLLDEQNAAWKRWKKGEREAAGRMFFKWYAPLVNSAARRYAAISQSDGFDDFQQIATAAIVEALDSFEPGRSQLPGYIKFQVFQRLNRRLTAQNGAYTIPSSRKERNIQLNFSRDCGAMLEEGLSWSEIRDVLAAKYKLHPCDADSLYAMRHGRQSVVEEVEEGGYGVVLEGYELPTVDLVSRAAANEAINSLFEAAGMTERERVCVRARFTDGEEVPFEELGAQFGVSRERVRQYIRQGLGKMRWAAKDRGLAFEDLW